VLIVVIKFNRTSVVPSSQERSLKKLEFLGGFKRNVVQKLARAARVPQKQERGGRELLHRRNQKPREGVFRRKKKRERGGAILPGREIGRKQSDRVREATRVG